MTLHQVFVSVLNMWGVLFCSTCSLLLRCGGRPGLHQGVLGPRSVLSARARTCRAWRGVGTEAVISLVVADGERVRQSRWSALENPGAKGSSMITPAILSTSLGLVVSVADTVPRYDVRSTCRAAVALAGGSEGRTVENCMAT